MRIMRILTAAAALLAVVALAAPAEAACGNASIIGTTNGGDVSFVMTEAFETVSYSYYGTPAGNIPPFSSNTRVTFWRQGTGDPTLGLGDDNGSFDMVAAGGIYYGAYPSYNFYFAAQIASGWSAPSVDGCIGGNSCQCLLLTDQDGDQGYYAIASAQSALTNDTFFNQGGTDGNGNNMPIVMRPVPLPRFNSSSRNGTTIELNMTVADDGGASYVKDGCACGPTGYKVLQQVVLSGAQPPSNRDLSGWTEAVVVGGGAQGVTPIGGNVNVVADCSDTGSDVYLATQMFFDSGFTTSIVSANSARVECDPNLADPNGTKPIRPNGPRTDRPTNPRRR